MQENATKNLPKESRVKRCVHTYRSNVRRLIVDGFSREFTVFDSVDVFAFPPQSTHLKEFQVYCSFLLSLCYNKEMYFIFSSSLFVFFFFLRMKRMVQCYQLNKLRGCHVYLFCFFFYLCKSKSY
uniref:Uncharacterized protein n=1 Tax=Cacopsylla melanoneura TaxID=428564 RepID=A0A8D9AAZ9_9HEMI